MSACLMILALAFITSLVATLAVRWGARRLGVVDRPDDYRKLHLRKVPLLGGVAIYVGFLAPVAVLLVWRQTEAGALLHARAGEVGVLLAAALVALATGIVDDVRGLPVHWKLIGQAVAASLAFAGGYAIGVISNPFGQPIVLGLLSFPVTLLWFIGCMNAVNLLDGLDGLAAGVCLFAGLTLLLVSLAFGQTLSVLLMASLSGAVFGFLLLNLYPASIFLGDSGSLVLGFLLAALSLQGARKSEATVALLIPFVAMGVPILDTALAILRRWARRLPVSAADRQHIHHVLLAMGLSQRQVVMVLYAACVALGAAALTLTASRSLVSLIVLGTLTVMALACIRVFGGLRFGDLWRRLAGGWKRRRQLAEAKVSVERVVVRMQTVADVDHLWQFFCTGLDSLGLDFAVLHLFTTGNPEPQILHWHPHGEPAAGPEGEELDSWLAHFKVRCNGHMFGNLNLGKHIRSGTMLTDTPELVDRLRHEMATHMERLAAG